MIDARDREHTQDVQGDRGPSGKRTPTHPQDAEASEVQDDKWDAADEIHTVGLAPDRLRRLDRVIGINPLNQGGREAAKGRSDGRHDIRGEAAKRLAGVGGGKPCFDGVVSSAGPS